MKRFSVTVFYYFLVLLTGFVSAKPLVYQVDPSHSTVGFGIRHLVSTVEGKFKDFSGQITLDENNLEASKVDFVVQAKSIDTGNSSRDDHLRNKDFFDVKKYRTLEFHSTRVKALSEKIFMVTGFFTMHGVKKVMNVKVVMNGPVANPRSPGVQTVGFETDFTVLRSDFGVNSWTDTAGVLGDEVQVRLRVEAHHKK